MWWEHFPGKMLMYWLCRIPFCPALNQSAHSAHILYCTRLWKCICPLIYMLHMETCTLSCRLQMAVGVWDRYWYSKSHPLIKPTMNKSFLSSSIGLNAVGRVVFNYRHLGVWAETTMCFSLWQVPDEFICLLLKSELSSELKNKSTEHQGK